MLVAGDVSDRVLLSKGGTKASEGVVLGGLEELAFQALQFDPNGVVVAVLASEVLRPARVPGSVVATDELPQVAIASDEKMRGHLQPAQLLEPGVLPWVQPVGEEALHFVTPVDAGRQTDGMQNQQVHHNAVGPGPEIR